MAPPKRVFRCGRCNRAFTPGEERVHSEWSGLSYCISVDACGRRAVRFKSRPEMTWKRSAIGASLPPVRLRRG